MGVFIKRPLCLFCFCFIGASLLACCFAPVIKLSLLCAALILAAIFFYLYKADKKGKYGFLESAIALIFACVALFQSFLFIDVPRSRYTALVSEGSAVEFVVTSEEYSSKYSTRMK